MPADGNQPGLRPVLAQKRNDFPADGARGTGQKDRLTRHQATSTSIERDSSPVRLKMTGAAPGLSLLMLRLLSRSAPATNRDGVIVAFSYSARVASRVAAIALSSCSFRTRAAV